MGVGLHIPDHPPHKQLSTQTCHPPVSVDWPHAPSDVPLRSSTVEFITQFLEELSNWSLLFILPSWNQHLIHHLSYTKSCFLTNTLMRFGAHPVVKVTTMKLYKLHIMNEDYISATHGRTVVWNHLMCLKVNSWDGTPWRWCRLVQKRVGVFVKQHELEYERQCIKC
jgi:hypothetical protein